VLVYLVGWEMDIGIGRPYYWCWISLHYSLSDILAGGWVGERDKIVVEERLGYGDRERNFKQ
jgi:hypothetical protein